jgi:hypothetical protein
MPGFIINGQGGVGSAAVKDTTDYYYTYTWEIENFYENQAYANIGIIHCKTITLPSFNVAQETVMGASLEYKFAKSVNWADVKVAWYDTAGFLDTVKQWRKTVWSPMYGFAAVAKYKKESRLRTFLPDGTGVQEYRLINSWPSVIKYGELTYTSSDIKKVEVTLTYDWAEEITQNSPDETSFGQMGDNIDRPLPPRPPAPPDKGNSGGE